MEERDASAVNRETAWPTEAQCRALIERSSDGLHLVSAAGILLFSSPSIAAISGRTPAEVAGRNFFEWLHPDDVGEIHEAFARFVETPGGEVTSQCRYLHKDGSWRWVEARCTNLLDAPEIRAIVCVVRDISEQHSAAQMRPHLAAIIESTDDAILNIDSAGIVQTWNPAADRMFGYSAREVLGQSILKLIHPDERKSLARHIRHCTQGGRLDSFELRGLRKGGAPLEVTVRLSTLGESRKGNAGVCVILRDITSQKQTEETLRKTEEQYWTLAESIPKLVWMSKADGSVEYLNQRWRDYTGIPPEGFEDGQWTKVVHPDDLPQVQAAWDNAFRTGESYEVEFRIRRADGQYRWHIARGIPLRDEAGHVEHWFGAATDIDGQRHAEQALRASENRFRAMVEKSFETIILVAADGAILYRSPAASNVLGYSHEEDIGRCAFDLLHPEDEAEVREKFARLLATPGGFETSILRGRHKDGSWRWLEAIATNLLHDPSVNAVVVNFRDITSRQQAEEENRKHQEVLQTVFDQIPVMVCFFDMAGRLQMVNRHWESVFGWTQEEARGRDILADLYPDPEYRSLVRGYIQNPPPGWAELRTHTRDGRTLDTLWAHVVLSDGTSIGFGQDVTEMRRLEAQLRQSQKMEALGKLAGGVAHDFNNLLTVISGYSEILLEELAEDAPSREPVEEIAAAAQRAAAFTRQLLAFSRKQMLAPKKLDLNNTIREAEKMLRRVIGEDIQLETSFAPNLAPITADPSQLEQVLLNLAVNARDAMPQGGKLLIETELVVFDEFSPTIPADVSPGRYVLLTVTDTGCGMSEEIRRHAFEPFFTNKGPGKGTGLGLAVVHGVIKQSGGHVEVFSELGKGTSFKIFLPCVESVEQWESPLTVVPPVPRGTETVLLVEDEEAVRAFTRRVLQNCGYTVLEASNGEEAMSLCADLQAPFHLLLSDVVMPGLGGRSLADQLLAKYPQMKVLFLSGYADDAVMRHGVLQEQTNFLQKPFSPIALARKVRQVLDAKT